MVVVVVVVVVMVRGSVVVAFISRRPGGEWEGTEVRSGVVLALSKLYYKH